MAAFMVIQADIKDREQFKAYTQVVPAIVKKYGGRYRVLGGDVEVLEGDWQERRIAVSEWPSMDVARQFWNSPEYREAKKLREGICDVQVLLIDGLASENEENE